MYTSTKPAATMEKVKNIQTNQTDSPIKYDHQSTMGRMCACCLEETRQMDKSDNGCCLSFYISSSYSVRIRTCTVPDMRNPLCLSVKN